MKKRHLSILYVFLAMAMLFTGCGKGWSKNGKTSFFAVTDTLTAEEKNTGILKGSGLTNQYIIARDWEKGITIVPDNGQALSITVKSYNATNTVLTIWVNDDQVESITLKGNQGVLANYLVTKPTDFKVRLASANGEGSFAATVNINQTN